MPVKLQLGDNVILNGSIFGNGKPREAVYKGTKEQYPGAPVECVVVSLQGTLGAFPAYLVKRSEFQSLRIRVTFDIVTEESAEEGDFASTGWEDEEGECFEFVEDAARWLRSRGPFEPSCSPVLPSNDFWLTYAGEVEYGERRLAYHFYNFTNEQRFQVYQILKTQSTVY